MQAREFNFTSDYATLQLWYVARDLPPVDIELLPKMGYIIDDVAALFVYETDSKICMIDGTISNPHADKEEKQRAWPILIEAAKLRAFNRGYNVVLVTTSSSYVVDVLKENGFTLQDKPTYLLGCAVNGGI